MLNWAIQITLISILIVFLVHHIIVFLKETLTVPKIKDLVNVPHERYRKMYETMNSNNKDKQINKNNQTNVNVLTNEDMKNELKQFMKMQQMTN